MPITRRMLGITAGVICILLIIAGAICLLSKKSPSEAEKKAAIREKKILLQRKESGVVISRPTQTIVEKKKRSPILNLIRKKRKENSVSSDDRADRIIRPKESQIKKKIQILKRSTKDGNSISPRSCEKCSEPKIRNLSPFTTAKRTIGKKPENVSSSRIIVNTG